MLKFADVTLEPETYHVRRAGKLLRLTTFQFAILRFLLEHPGRVFSYGELRDAVWQDPHVSRFAVRRTIVRLRQALNAHGGTNLIRSVRAVGYVLKTDDCSSTR